MENQKEITEKQWNDLYKYLIIFRCWPKEVFVSKLITLPKSMTNQQSFRIHVEDNLSGVVVLGSNFPFEMIDMEIQDMLDAFSEIYNRRQKYHEIYTKDKSDIIWNYFYKKMIPEPKLNFTETT